MMMMMIVNKLVIRLSYYAGKDGDILYMISDIVLRIVARIHFSRSFIL